MLGAKTKAEMTTSTLPCLLVGALHQAPAQNQNWLPELCFLGVPNMGNMATSPMGPQYLAGYTTVAVLYSSRFVEEITHYIVPK